MATTEMHLGPGFILLVGAGALGSHVAYALRSELPRLWVIVDFDTVEAKNTLAQLHPQAHIGMNKASSLRQVLRGLFGVTVNAKPVRFARTNAEVLVKGAALVLDACDNPEARQDIRDACRAAAVPLLHLGVDGAGQLGIVAWDASYTIDPAPAGQVATCEGGEHLPMLVRIAAEAALVVQRYVRTGEQVSRMVSANAVVGL